MQSEEERRHGPLSAKEADVFHCVQHTSLYQVKTIELHLNQYNENKVDFWQVVYVVCRHKVNALSWNRNQSLVVGRQQRSMLRVTLVQLSGLRDCVGEQGSNPVGSLRPTALSCINFVWMQG